MSDDGAPSRGRRGRAVLIAVAVAVGCLGLAEGALRLVGGRGDSGWASVPALEERVAAVRPKQPGELRVLALGGSLTEYQDDGGGNWARVLEAEAKAAGKGVTLYNFGQEGTRLPHYLKNLEDFGARVQPDLVVIELNLGEDVLGYERALAAEERGLPVGAPQTLNRRQSGLARHSALASLLTRAWSATRPGLTSFAENIAHISEIYGISAEEAAARVRAHDPAVVALAERARLSSEDLAFGLLVPHRYADLLKVRAGTRVPAAIERLLADVARAEGICRKLNAACAWVALPGGLQIDERYHPRYARMGFETAGWMAEPTPLAAQVLPAMKARGAFVIDTLPALQASDRELLLPDDTRLNEAGQRVVGRAAFAALAMAQAFEGGLRVRDAEPDGAAVAAADPRVLELLKGTALADATAEERRLALKIAALQKLRDEMQGILTSLPKQRDAAEKMQAEVVALERELPPEAVKRALADAEARFQKDGAAPGTLLARAREMDAELGRLLEKEPPAASDGASVQALKAELAKQQAATSALGAGTAVAFRALRMLEQMKLALPALRELKTRKGG